MSTPQRHGDPRRRRQVSEALYVVQKGAVTLGIRTNVGKELGLDMRSEGEVFGLLPLIRRDVAGLDVAGWKIRSATPFPPPVSRRWDLPNFFA